MQLPPRRRHQVGGAEEHEQIRAQEAQRRRDPRRHVGGGRRLHAGQFLRADEVSRPAVGAQAIGIARAAYEYALDYAKERKQFGRPIGSFQALKHRMADLYVAVQSARAVVNDAVAEPSATIGDAPAGSIRT